MSRYGKLRRRIAPVAFLLAIGLLARDACSKQQRIHAMIVLELGSAQPRVRSVSAELVVEGEVIATFRRTALPDATIGSCTFAVSMPVADGEVQIDVDLGGAHKRLTRRVYAHPDATIVIPLAAALE